MGFHRQNGHRRRLHDGFGLNLPPEIIFKLDCVADVEKAIA